MHTETIVYVHLTHLFLNHRFLDEIRTVDLVPNGGDVIVTAANRQEFVQLYAEEILVHSVKKVN